MSGLPNGWITARLEEFCHVEMGQAPPSSTYNSHGSGLPFLQGKKEFGKLYPTPTKFCSSPSKVANPGDVLLSVRAPVGATNIAPQKYCIGRGLAAISPCGGISNRFVFWALSSYGPTLTKAGTGSTFAAISKAQVVSIPITLPPIKEQRRIVEKIEALFEEIDRGVESLRAAKSALDLYRKSLLKSAFEGRLTADWRASNPEDLEIPETLLARIRKEHESRLKVALDVTDLPPNWFNTTVAAISDSLRYGYTAKANPEADGPRMLRITDIQNGQVRWSGVPRCEIEPEKRDDFLLSPGDIVFARTGGTVGKSFLIRGVPEPAVFASYLIKVSPATGVEPRYLYWFFQSLMYWEQIALRKGGLQGNVNAKTLGSIELAFAPTNEQVEVARILDARIETIQILEAEIDRVLARADLFRQSILKKAFAGKLVPQEPGDEPAVALLARIKEGRAQTALHKRKLGDRV